MAELGRRVLTFDLDGQADLTKAVGIKKDVYGSPAFNVYNAMLDDDGEPNDLIRRAPNDAFHVVPGNKLMGVADRDFTVKSRENRDKSWHPLWRLKANIGRIHDPYDCILMDCPADLNAVTD